MAQAMHISIYHYLPSKSGHIWMSIDYGDNESKQWLQGNVLKMDTISQEM